MPNSVNESLVQHADDSALLVSIKIIEYITNTLNQNLNECYKWLIGNKLPMHPGKTELILFGSKSKLRKIKEFTVTCEGQVTKASTSVKYLGLTLNQSFFW